MNGTQWIIFILIIQVIHFLGTWKLYVKAGRKAWEAAIPVYNAIVLMQIINRPKWWVILLFIPIINLLMFPVVWVETLRSFGKNSLLDTWLAILTLGLYIYYVNYFVEDVKYIENRDIHPKTALGEWVSSIVFAIVAATLVHTYLIQPFVIPTSSLEKTLLVGDFLFVSKFHYGARIPMTTVAAPMVHDTLPILKTRSYVADVDPATYKTSVWNKLQLPYLRLPGFKKVKRNDIVVFSWPADTVYQFFKRQQGVRKPIDKKSNYVKRCVGVPGDSLTIKDGYVYINGEKTVLPYRAKPEFLHTVTVDGQFSNAAIELLGRENLSGNVIRVPNSSLQQERATEVIQAMNLEQIKSDTSYTYYAGNVGNQKVKDYLKSEDMNNMALFNLTEAEAKNYTGKDGIASINKFSYKNPDTSVFPQDPAHTGTVDNMGTIYIPEKGKTVPLNIEVLPIYEKIIKEYEGNDIKVNGNQILINGEVANSYTFDQNYYWMMGDNRHRSEDSRFWGYVPEDHIVGTPIFIWMSIDGINDGMSNWKVRWDRVFTTVNGDGEPTSYFKYFLILLAAWFIFDFFRKKKKVDN
ncbi:signal peptidase I [Arenibacter algicola]|jgi:signal peptidase I|uniref:Signal peptidase I n=1 Tax=Arenibacter algicola TaxID=616991 RepID=A0ABY3ABQ4_9FLAO|nr:MULTISPECIES: signal peptidase I [Arenibacter]MDX1769072.1 signal peptidase I [Arenibacter troitsensis]GBF19554.1 signal peptidase I [Arenibacter sp. NBRC 103722]|tara:strand:- start:2692 stop:4425 length:1734 start_codon:yes stop_codon:yes gene_type:complete